MTFLTISPITTQSQRGEGKGEGDKVLEINSQTSMCNLIGLQHSNPINPDVAYKGPSKNYGTANDPMVGHKIGGVNVFGGGLPLYDNAGNLLGAIGVSGDSSCADHNIAWKVRHILKLDYVPSGVSPTKDDNIVNDIIDGKSKSGWGHPICSDEAAKIAKEFPNSHPIRSKK